MERSSGLSANPLCDGPVITTLKAVILLGTFAVAFVLFDSVFILGSVGFVGTGYPTLTIQEEQITGSCETGYVVLHEEQLPHETVEIIVAGTHVQGTTKDPIWTNDRNRSIQLVTSNFHYGGGAG